MNSQVSQIYPSAADLNLELLRVARLYELAVGTGFDGSIKEFTSVTFHPDSWAYRSVFGYRGTARRPLVVRRSTREVSRG